MDLEPGSVLNGIYRVERFIARGGMGDVYAGVNIETGERVAIKAVPHPLNSDLKALAMLRAEARLLTRVIDPAIVPYRVFARDPDLRIHYIVTDLIDGEVLSERLVGTPAAPADVAALLRRLATGLRTLHAAGAVHCDVAPDNVILHQGRIEEAKILDLGIARSLDPGDATVIIEGFAGKLGFVAPEQLGMGGAIGPWTDIYSAALVVLAFAGGGAAPMGRTPAEAVDLRRNAPSLDAAPPALRPLLRDMLSPKPVRRLQSMDDVLRRLDAIEGAAGAPRRSKPWIAAPRRDGNPPNRPARRTRLRRTALAVAACAFAVTTASWTTRLHPPGGDAHVPRTHVVKRAAVDAAASPLPPTASASPPADAVLVESNPPPTTGRPRDEAATIFAGARRSEWDRRSSAAITAQANAAIAASTFVRRRQRPTAAPAPAAGSARDRARMAAVLASAQRSVCRRYDGAKWRYIGRMTALDCAKRAFDEPGTGFAQTGVYVMSRRADRIGIAEGGDWLPVASLVNDRDDAPLVIRAM